MRESYNFKDKSFAVYGLGVTGDSVVEFLKKKRAYKIHAWDDYLIKSNLYLKNRFINSLNTVDYIVMSPGINILKSKFKKILLKNNKKIITDLDLFFLQNKPKKSIVITGTNGKSTTCSLIHHVLKKNGIKNKLVGNIGKPILDVKYKKNEIYVIEASSFQLEYSKFIKPYCAAILNISQDHLDWHGSKKKYIRSKIKIFNNQTKHDIAFLNDLNLKQLYKKNNFLGKLNYIKNNLIKITDNQNQHLKLEANKNNVKFAYYITKIFNVDKKAFLKSLESFKGLAHRYEVFYKKNNKVFVNDSKATTFMSTSYALKSSKNIFWILGGLPKLRDKFQFSEFKKNIIKAYIIGKYRNHFKKYLKGKINFELYRDLKSAINSIFKEIRRIERKKITILFSPAAASYDHYKNFEDRGNTFKKLTINYAKRYF